jgi:hypothetical protein
LQYRQDELDLSQAFQSYFTNAIVSVEEDLCSGLCTTPKGQKQLFLF